LDEAVEELEQKQRSLKLESTGAIEVGSMLDITDKCPANHCTNPRLQNGSWKTWRKQSQKSSLRTLQLQKLVLSLK
jgi:hypothetical protein